MNGLGGNLPREQPPTPNTMKVLLIEGKIVEIDLYQLAGNMTSAWLHTLLGSLDKKGIRLSQVNSKILSMPDSRTLQKNLHYLLNRLNEETLKNLRESKIADCEVIAKELGIEVEEKEALSDSAKLPIRKPVGPGPGI